MNHLNLDELASELKAIEAESMGWIPLEQGAYIHHGELDPSDPTHLTIHVVGVPDAAMAGMNVLLLVGW